MVSSPVVETVSSPAALELHDVPRSDVWETIRRGARLISSKTGIIRQVGHGLYHAQDPLTFSLGIAAGDLSRFSDIANTSKGGGGGESLEAALAATIGEAVERYSMLFYDRRAMVFATYRDVQDVAPSPDDLRLFSADQVERRPPKSRLAYFTEDSKVNWVWGTSLSTGRSRLVPASLVYLGYMYAEDEAVIGRNASSGLAAGLTREEAILTGIYELIERDAFTIRWLQRAPGRRIEVDVPELAQALERRFHAKHPNVDIQIFDTTLDVAVPSAFLAMRRPAEFGPALCIGAAARLDLRDAIVKCMREAGQALPYFRFLLGQIGDWEPAADFTDLVSFDHHCVLYLKRPELVSQAMAPWDAVEETVRLSSIPDRSTGRVLSDIQSCVEALRAAGLEVIVVDITTPDVEEVGMRVVRVLIPGLMPLHGNHNYPYLGVRRLYDAPRALGWERAGWDPTAGINPLPHPFP